ncbi:MAG: sigma-70 family RNA polymerase sigma factor [Solirubrobacterales bacterium]|nr:sigma-70 family RNA polymerase sigma factor [Solirubrobacterales bacterium]
MPISPQTARKLDDEELLTLVGQRDQIAFEAFYDRFERQAFSLSYRIIGERAAAEDTVQEGFLSIWKSGERYDSTRGSAGAWALGIVRNRAIDTLRSRASRTPTLDSDDDGILESRPGEDRTDELAFRRETQREVQEVIADLPDKQSKVIKLAFFGGFSQSEISEMLDLPLGTVKGRMRLGLEKLRGGLADEGKVTI